MIRTKEFYPEGWLLNTPENRAATATPTALADAAAAGTVLEANVILCDAAHNLIVDLGCMKGLILREEGAVGIAEGTVRDIALISRVGKPVCFTVTAIKTNSQGRLYAELSRRAAQLRCLEQLHREKPVGSVLNARVTHLESFGAFCDVGCGIAALLPIDAISVSRISHPRDRLRVGQDLRVVVRAVDENGRITLTQKELLGTWAENAAEFSEGQTVSGIIRSVESYGIFVELTPNLAGLAEPKPAARAGMLASVFVKSIIQEKMKVKLIIIDCFEGDYTPPLQYFFNGSSMQHWQYSPENSTKNIYTDFV